MFDNSSEEFIGYKFMRTEGGSLISGANSNLKYELLIGSTISMPGQGVFLSSNEEYVLDYYSGLSDNEVLLTLSFKKEDIKFGMGCLNDSQPEIGVSNAIIKDFRILNSSLELDR